jgi:phospholipase C
MGSRTRTWSHSFDPPAPDDEPETFGSYGVRVPVFVVSPWVEPATVSSTVFDHASIAKTILLRLCPEQAATHELVRLGHPAHTP